jgi:hypothetical protein
MGGRAKVAAVVALVAGALTITIDPSQPASASGACVMAAGNVSCTFAYTGAEQTFVVPDRITAVDVLAIGASGGSTSADAPHAGGAGAIVRGSVAVMPGQTLYVSVGQPGTFRYDRAAGSSFNGGGEGGAPSSACPGASGGGATDVRALSRHDDGSLASRLVVAGGGGGAPVVGGSGGSADAAGTAGGDDEAGGPGTTATGGSAGVGRGAAGEPGRIGVGGAGATGDCAGGGGGGGVFGGGGGAPGAGGGGGSSLVPDGGTAALAVRYTAPQVVLSYRAAPAVVGVDAPPRATTEPGRCSAVVGAPTVSVTGSPAPTLTFSPTLPATLPAGRTGVTVVASNGVGRDAVASFDVVVDDVEAPVFLRAPAAIVAAADDAQGALVTYAEPEAVDNCTGVTVRRRSGPPSGAIFPLGDTTVTHVAIDDAGNETTLDLVVRVLDDDAPSITLRSRTPEPNGAGWNNRTVELVWDCADNVGVVTTEVRTVVDTEGQDQRSTGVCTDTTGAIATDTVERISVDVTPPVLRPTVTSSVVPVGGVVAVSPGATDALSGIASAQCDAVDTSAAVTRRVACRAVDRAGNTATSVVSIDVVWSCGTVVGTEAQLRARGYTVMIGTDGADELVGTAGADFILGLGGDDEIEADRGDDVVCGGAGNDVIDGDAGNDIIDGGSGRDRLTGGSGNDQVLGGEDADILSGGSGTDVCDGGPDIDSASSCETRSNVP